MRNKALTAICCLVACLMQVNSLDAQPFSSRSEGLPVFVRGESGADALQNTLARLRAHRPAASPTGKERAARALLIPASANARGGNGAHFRSDLTIVLHWVHPSPQANEVQVIWIPERNPEGAVEFIGSMEWPGVHTYHDFVGEVLGLTGTGALLIVPLDGDGLPDPERSIEASSRIWTPAADGAPGTLSLQFPALDFDDLVDGGAVWISGLRLGTQYRANYGIFNLSDEDLTFEVVLNPHVASGAEVLERLTLRPGQLLRRTLPLGGSAWNSSYPVLEIRSIGEAGKSWTAYASSTHNDSGDGWVSLASRVPEIQGEP